MCSRSPRMRGWTGLAGTFPHPATAFPAHAGMDRHRQDAQQRATGVPRACGDGPGSRTPRVGAIARSPRMRGWTAEPAAGGWKMNGVPRACGDGPALAHVRQSQAQRSPRMRGWTGRAGRARRRPDAFPAHAGMDRVMGWPLGADRGVPRACGDGPDCADRLEIHMKRSPRMRGWTASDSPQSRSRKAFPAHAGMDRLRRRTRGALISVPRACGDGPAYALVEAQWVVAFPAHAGMDRCHSGLWIGCATCSPRMRGWTGPLSVNRARYQVFPAHAGMDRHRRIGTWRLHRVPRACGDGPWLRCPP